MNQKEQKACFSVFQTLSPEDRMLIVLGNGIVCDFLNKRVGFTHYPNVEAALVDYLDERSFHRYYTELSTLFQNQVDILLEKNK